VSSKEQANMALETTRGYVAKIDVEFVFVRVAEYATILTARV
jgi:hypothetical protein